LATTIKVFDFEMDGLHGARIVIRQEPISSACLSDGEIDAQIVMLKDNLDAVAKRMKEAIRQPKKPLFTGES
jgi:hypothetical protein